MASESAAPASATSNFAAASTVVSPTTGQLSFWEQSLIDHKANLLTCMLLHDDEAEAADMNEGEIEEILTLCDLQKEWIVCGESDERMERR
jgi:hypothetical protein